MKSHIESEHPRTGEMMTPEEVVDMVAAETGETIVKDSITVSPNAPSVEAYLVLGYAVAHQFTTGRPLSHGIHTMIFRGQGIVGYTQPMVVDGRIRGSLEVALRAVIETFGTTKDQNAPETK